MAQQSFNYSSYVVYNRRPTLTNFRTHFEDTEVAFRCPNCGTYNKPLTHGQLITCKCGAKLNLQGNDLSCTTFERPHIEATNKLIEIYMERLQEAFLNKDFTTVAYYQGKIDTLTELFST